MQRIVVLVMLSAAMTACGGDSKSNNNSPPATYGTCDRIALVGGCIESTGTAIDIVNQKKGCQDAGGTWTSEPCPDANQVGCCTYTFGMDFRECWYTSSTTADPQAACATMQGSVWTPAP